MKNLKESILSKKTGVYKGASLPTNRTDKDGIIDWLEKNGFERLSYPENTSEMKYMYGKCYSLGLYNDDNLATWWINAGDGNGNAILVRTLDDGDLKKANKTSIVKLHECSILEYNKVGREGNWKETRELLIKMAEI